LATQINVINGNGRRPNYGAATVALASQITQGKGAEKCHLSQSNSGYLTTLAQIKILVSIREI